MKRKDFLVTYGLMRMNEVMLTISVIGENYGCIITLSKVIHATLAFSLAGALN